ncbi:MAG: glycerophosphodiester phosphodiesterase [Mariniblastus sp.]
MTSVVLALVSQSHGQTVVAHRGSSISAPENTLAAFRLAWEQNADAIEADFHMTSDEQIVCLHDKTTKRTAPGQTVLSVATSSLVDLKKLDVGSWKSSDFAGEPIPTMAEVLNTVPKGKQIFVEIKCGVEVVPHLAKILSAAELEAEQVVIICFSKKVVQAIRRKLPQFKCNWLTSYKNDSPEKLWRPTKEQVSETLDKLGATGIGSQFNRDVVDQAFVDSIQSQGLGFHVWTVDEPAQIQSAFEMGVDSVTTNCPDVAIGIRDGLKSESKTKSKTKSKEPAVSGARK